MSNGLFRRVIPELAAVAFAPLAAAGTLFVDASALPGGDGLAWQTAFIDLQDALAAAAADPAVTDIWVAHGTYKPDHGTQNRDATFALLSGVALFGGFAGGETELDQRDPAANPTVVSGDLQGNDLPGFGSIGDNSRHIVTAQGVDESAVLDGFVISGGNADFEGEDLLGGGGMFIADASPAVRQCRFESNSAGKNEANVGGFGGALYIAVGRPNIENCTFADNRADNGGAVGVLTLFDDLTAVTITGCTFESNTAEFGIGGAVYSGASVFPPSDQAVTFRGCAFTTNTATYAGAVADFNSTDLSFADCRFTANNSATAGAVWNAQTAGIDTHPAVIRSCIFDSNLAATAGGALVFGAADALIVDSLFVGNRAAVGFGGAISHGPYNVFDPGGDLDVWNCTFSGNRAILGGAVATDQSERVRIANSTLAANTADLAGGIAAFSPIEVANAILWSNTAGGIADESAQIFHDPSLGPLSIDFTLVQGLTGNLGGQGNLGADPRFNDPDGADNTPGTIDDDLSLTLESPAIDAADNARIPADTLDLDADGDTSEPLPFDFAGNARRADIPAIPDTGLGQAPIADMGAFEAQPEGCYPDCTADGALDLFDFLCFTNAFNDPDPYADCTGDGAYDLFDFLCFVNAFNAGC